MAEISSFAHKVYDKKAAQNRVRTAGMVCSFRYSLTLFELFIGGANI